MKAKHENLRSSALIYVFVDFGTNPSGAAKSWIIPASIVASVLKRSHQAWLSGEGRSGRQRNDSDMRRLLSDYSKFGLPELDGWLDPHFENWTLLFDPK